MAKILVLILLLSSRLVWADQEEEFAGLFETHRQTLLHLEETHPKLLILFSGTPGMGKTSVAKALEDHLHAVRLSTDEIRLLLKERGLSPKDAYSYLQWCLRKLSVSSPNQLIILDCSIDRTYESCAKFAQEYGYKTFLIRMQMERKVVEERILSRGIDTEAFLRDLDRYWADYELSCKNQKADYLFDNNSDLKKSFPPLLEQLKSCCN